MHPSPHLFSDDQVSSEIDWQRFLWGFMADPDPSLPLSEDLPTFLTIMEIFETTGTLVGNDVYANFQAALDDPLNANVHPYRERFAAIALKNGVQTNE